MAQEIGNRIYKRERKHTEKSGGIKALPLQMSTATRPWRSDERPRTHGHRHDNPADESPTSGKQGCSERR